VQEREDKANSVILNHFGCPKKIYSSFLALKKLMVFLFLLIDRHMVIQTSQSIGDAPYGDHFTVEVWNLQYG
jgi:hypothetical protein